MSAADDTGLVMAVADFDAALAAEVAEILGLQVRSMEALDAADPQSDLCVVLYQAPWEGCLALADLDGGLADAELAARADSWLDAWLAAYSRVAALQTQWPERVRLVNTGRDDAAGVLSRLAGLPMDSPAQARLQAALPQGPNALSRTLGTWMTETATPLWRVYEMLESCAESDGRPAEFRIGLRSRDDGRHGAAVRVLIDAMQAAAAASQATRAASQNRVAMLEDTLDDLQHENALLAVELQQLHVELAQQGRSEQALHALVLDAGRAAEQARHWIADLNLAAGQND